MGKEALSSFGVKMAASSVTGTGPGESFGLYKPQNNGSCGCTSFPSAQPKPVVRKRGCSLRGFSGGGVVRYTSRSSSLGEKSCF